MEQKDGNYGNRLKNIVYLELLRNCGLVIGRKILKVYSIEICWKAKWKCDNLNESSKKSALRLGFTKEGIFRQAQVYKGRNRDTAWFSILDKEWKDNKKRFEEWLREENFDENGNQIMTLSGIRINDEI